MEPYTDTSALPLSIAQVESTALGDPGHAPVPGGKAAADLSGVHDQLLAAVVTRVGEVEAAEWALDQAKAAGDAQIRAALSSGVPADKVAEAAGTCASALAGGTLGQSIATPK
ncbi:hypothetical protein QFZ79_001882 [Arthrobacter sp. V4I6]|uniref:hypothetical protein n=1 Tax=unclassified Arthrobacter TaxID=235627 RepID=UPI002781CD9F|nr:MULTISPECIES: hypothetical protein [unclassified Arthrobacter]MDQ0819592.1 hypothetical protein [Arthrobacter sp. V1I7]MDQ0853771.1 hypothetical protein [Arthrobacter sp. V4I6]